MHVYGKVQRGQCVSTPQRLFYDVKRQRATETEEDSRSQLGLTSVGEFPFYSISGGGTVS